MAQRRRRPFHAQFLNRALRKSAPSALQRERAESFQKLEEKRQPEKAQSSKRQP